MSVCGATVSRHQTTQTRPTHDTFTPAGYGSPGLSIYIASLSPSVTCATLDSMILYNRPRTRGEVADFSAAAYGRLYVIMIFSGRLYVSHVRPSYHIRTSARGRADVLTIGRGLDQGRDRRTDADRRTGEDAGDRGGFTARRSGRGLGGLLLSDEADRMTARR